MGEKTISFIALPRHRLSSMVLLCGTMEDFGRTIFQKNMYLGFHIFIK